MSTPLTDSIQNLIDYINEVTGSEDTTLSDAVATLAAGHGGISIDDIAMNVDLGDLVITSNEIKSNTLSYINARSIYGPNVAFIDRYGLQSVSIQQASFPNLLRIGYASFINCTSMRTISVPKLQEIGIYGFQNCTALTKLSLPSCSSISVIKPFRGCTNLTDLYLPNAESTYPTAEEMDIQNATIHYNTQFDENGEPILE